MASSASREGRLTVLVVGQTPPPLHGQAIMIEQLLHAPFSRVALVHVRMGFSGELAEVGRFRAAKLVHLAELVARIWHARFRSGARVLYYPPAGPTRVAVYRDVALLLATRFLFDKTVFHFHASGLSVLGARLSRLERALVRCAYGRPDCAIVLSDRNPPDAAFLRARRTVVVPYGIADPSLRVTRKRPASDTVRILYVGALREAKGVMVLLEAALELRARGARFELVLVGAWQQAEFRARAEAFIAEHALAPLVRLPGSLDGDEKWQAYADADVFCFPTFFEAESFGVVLLEAMAFALPIVATDYRGVASVVDAGVTGRLVAPRDPHALADQLLALCSDAEKRRELGAAGRARYLASYTLERFYANMEAALLIGAECP